MTVSFEAVPHSPSSGVAQPQSSMKESHPAKVHLQEVDQTATASSTSNKSTSLQLLLLLHMTAGIAALRAAETEAAAQLEHAAGRCRRQDGDMPRRHGRVPDQVLAAAAAGTSAGGCLRILRNLPYDVHHSWLIMHSNRMENVDNERILSVSNPCQDLGLCTESIR